MFGDYSLPQLRGVRYSLLLARLLKHHNYFCPVHSDEPLIFPYVKDELLTGRGFFALLFNNGRVQDRGGLRNYIFSRWDFTDIEPGHTFEAIYSFKRNSSSIIVGEVEFYTNAEETVELRMCYYGKFSNLLELPPYVA